MQNSVNDDPISYFHDNYSVWKAVKWRYADAPISHLE